MAGVLFFASFMASAADCQWNRYCAADDARTEDWVWLQVALAFGAAGAVIAGVVAQRIYDRRR